jgi:hypothetical protein
LTLSVSKMFPYPSVDSRSTRVLQGYVQEINNCIVLNFRYPKTDVC